jgi:hypothetical protein
VGVLLLNFEGEDEATTWEEEEQGLEPYLQTYGCELDTAQHQSGVSSLLLPSPTISSYNMLQYEVPGIDTTQFTYTSHFMYDSITSQGSGGVMDFLVMGNDDPTYNYFGMDLHRTPAGVLNLIIIGIMPDHSYFPEYTEPTTLEPDVWHKAEWIVSGKNIIGKIDNEEMVNWTATIDDPFINCRFTSFLNLDSVGNLWMDTVSIVNTIPVGESGSLLKIRPEACGHVTLA